MGLIISKLGDLLLNYFKDNHSRILMLGLDAAGKTTILYKLKLPNESVTTIPTIGLNAEELSHKKNVTFTVWDVSSQSKMRDLWRQCYQGTEGLIFVVDSADRFRFEEAKEVLFGIIESDEMRGVPVCVIANKQDLPDALSPSGLEDALSLNKLYDNPWHLQAAQATTGEGLYEAIDELARMIKENKSKR